MSTEKEYIDKIVELEKENDELYDLLGKAKAKIEELQTWQTLNGIRNSKDKKLAAFEGKIKELEGIAELSSLGQLHDYDRELALLTKKVIKLRIDIAKLSKSKHTKSDNVAKLEEVLDNVSTEIAEKYVMITYLYDECAKFKGEEISSDVIDGLLDNVGSLKSIIVAKTNTIKELRKENDRLKQIITDSGNSKYTIEELEKQIKMKDGLIENLNRRIKTLEGDIDT